jgi:hypothetical protein
MPDRCGVGGHPAGRPPHGPARIATGPVARHAGAFAPVLSARSCGRRVRRVRRVSGIRVTNAGYEALPERLFRPARACFQRSSPVKCSESCLAGVSAGTRATASVGRCRNRVVRPAPAQSNLGRSYRSRSRFAARLALARERRNCHPTLAKGSRCGASFIVRTHRGGSAQPQN